jgi:hypothetical protein
METFSERAFELFTGLETYQSPYAESISNPEELVKNLTETAAIKAAGLSAGLSLPGGFVSLFTILPELFLVYRIQGQLVKDIASLYGKESYVNRELLVYCMFKQTGIQFLERMVEDIGTKIIIRPSTIKFLESLLEKIGIQVSKRLLKKNLLKWLPIIGAVLTGGLTYFDTKYVASTAVGMFSKKIEILDV